MEIRLSRSSLRNRSRGVSLIEILVALAILAIGLLGVAGLQSRMQSTEMESYQRVQALLLLDDMASRMAANPAVAAQDTYVTGLNNPLGTGMTCPTTSSTTKQADFSQWCQAIQGAGEQVSGSKTGSVIGGRGCIEKLGTNLFMITVAWQGLVPIWAPPDSVACGQDQYDDASIGCTADQCRRVVTTVIRIGNL